MPRKTRTVAGQLALFDEPTARAPAPGGAGAQPDALALRFARLRSIAAQLPPQVRFGTSSWSFPGWCGLVFPPGCTRSFLAREGLALYVQHPLLGTVGIDRGYYAPIPAADLEAYAQQLPRGFPCCAKVPGAFTTPVHLGRGGAERGAPNPWFLHAPRFVDTVAVPFLEAFAEHTASLILEFPPLPRAHRLSPTAFTERLDAFLEAVPSELSYSVEIRDKALLTPAYARVLARHGASHVYSYWSDMPMVADQQAVVPLDGAPFSVVRLLLPPGSRYEERRKALAPFDRLVDPNATMRAQVLALVRSAAAAGRTIFVLVNNKAEGSAPLTVEELAQALVNSPIEPSTGAP